VGLFLLLVNDYFLKQAFPGAISGKLSDFAGLFIFSMLAIEVFSKKPAVTLALIGITFIFWKSSLSDAFISIWNLNGVYRIGRVVDYSDLMALSVLPVARKYSLMYVPINVKPLFLFPIFLLTVVSIMGTSVARYGVIVEIPDETHPTQIQNVTSADVVPLLGLVRDAALSLGLECLSCEKTGFYRSYVGREVFLEVNYEPTIRKVYLGIRTSASFVGSFEDQQTVVENARSKIEGILEEYSYNILIPSEASFVESYYEAKLTIKSPTKGVPFSSKHNGDGNKDIEAASTYVNDYLKARGFKSAQPQYYPSTSAPSSYQKNMRRRYIGGRATGPSIESVSTTIEISGYVSWFGTYLHVEIVQLAEDSTVDMSSIVAELHQQLMSRLPKNVDIDLEIGTVPGNAF